MQYVNVLQAQSWLQGRLTVVLDLDGTLVSSFTPRRAPRLTGGITTHLVGRGSHLNPNGVFVVERPGLQDFLSRLSTFAGVLCCYAHRFMLCLLCCPVLGWAVLTCAALLCAVLCCAA